MRVQFTIDEDVRGEPAQPSSTSSSRRSSATSSSTTTSSLASSSPPTIFATSPATRSGSFLPGLHLSSAAAAHQNNHNRTHSPFLSKPRPSSPPLSPTLSASSASSSSSSTFSALTLTNGFAATTTWRRIGTRARPGVTFLADEDFATVFVGDDDDEGGGKMNTQRRAFTTTSKQQPVSLLRRRAWVIGGGVGGGSDGDSDVAEVIAVAQTEQQGLSRLAATTTMPTTAGLQFLPPSRFQSQRGVGVLADGGGRAGGGFWSSPPRVPGVA
ncbi:hypothetical protein BDZ88DRAFT_402505 [Geranomyces variabilis]|nr:hypothetical protein BDZ88DRAFT_402505 [Geranomyces variabilis]KAJ3142951.1 hypothetical protein HDU90_002824 [Geranomyces variabilis]